MASSSSLPTYLGFFLIPVLGTMLQIPTLHKAAANKWKSPAPALNLKVLEEHFMFSQNKWKTNWWTAVTHMFLHEDYSHLVGNASALTTAGYFVSRNFGVMTCWSVFLGGGIFSAVSGWGQVYQQQQHLKMIDLPDHWSGTSIATLAELWDTHVAPMTAPYLAKHYVARLGCSAGITALNGMNVMYMMEEVLFATILCCSSSSPVDLDLLFRAAQQQLLPIISNVYFLSEEFFSIQAGNASGIDHAGHLTGFGFGAVCYVLHKILSYDFSKRKKTPMTRSSRDSLP